ncbi:MAG: SH3 domain-containing protein [Bacteroidaceae bacterium]|nr:SH3 domain-containing protein [Bacteroidaceae bacterium]
MKDLYLIILCTCLAVTPTTAYAQTLSSIEETDSAATVASPLQPTPSKALADSAYTAEDYQLAASLYSALLAENGESAMIYYNLGNSYFRMDSLGRAILNYERALLLDPADTDIRFNLQLARSHTADKVTPVGEMFFVTWWKVLTLSLNVQTWGWMALATFVLMLAAIGLYIFVPSVAGRKIAFSAAIVMLLLCVVANIAAAQARQHLLNRTGAIVMHPSAVVHSTPSQSGKDLFILHEGTHVELLDDSMSDWIQIQMPDGKEGWISRNEIERI